MGKLIYGHENVKRAIEVAAVSGVGLSIVGRVGFGVDAINNFISSIGTMNVKFIEICEFDSEEQTIRNAKDIRSNPGLMVIMAPENPHFDTYMITKSGTRKTEGVNMSIERIKMAIDHYPIPLNLNPSCVALLRNAFERLNLNYDYADTIIKVAEGIARLDRADKIESHHIAEAIHYCPKMLQVQDMLNYWKLEQSI